MTNPKTNLKMKSRLTPRGRDRGFVSTWDYHRGEGKQRDGAPLLLDLFTEG